MRVFVIFLTPRGQTCDTIADALSAPDRFLAAASQTPRDLAESCLAYGTVLASESAPSRVFSHTPIAQSYPRIESSAGCAVHWKREKDGRSTDRITTGRAPGRTNR